MSAQYLESPWLTIGTVVLLKECMEFYSVCGHKVKVEYVLNIKELCTLKNYHLKNPLVVPDSDSVWDLISLQMQRENCRPQTQVECSGCRNELLRGSRRLDFMINESKSHILRFFGGKSTRALIILRKL